MQVRDYLNYWSSRYKEDMLQDIMPFWAKYGWDQKNGGIYTCIDRDGTLMDSTKSVWFQGRFAYICAFAYNHIEKSEQWLVMAKSCIDFFTNHCTDDNGRMYFEVTASGEPIRMRRYVFSESFAALALAEYSLATGDHAYAVKALAVFKNIQRLITTPGLLEPKYDDMVHMKSHSIVMILLNVAAEIRKVIQDPCLEIQINQSIDELTNDFVQPQYKALFETVGPNGEFIDTMIGRTINPGHCIETSWFLLEEAKYRNWDPKIRSLALQILEWSWEWGWDKEYGGIINFKDCKNFPSQDYSQDMKFWWPQTEIIIASLYAYQATKDEKYLKRHQLVSDWAYAHFPDYEKGEWYGYLHRDGTIAQSAKGNIFKGPFHVPRMMIKCYSLCQELLNE